MDLSTLTLERRGAVEILSLNRPDALNAMSPEMVSEMRTYFEGLLARLDVRVVLLRAEGRMFSAGADLGSVAFAETGEGRAQRQMAMQKLYSGLVRLMRACPQPIIAAIDGICAGAGAILAMASDMRIGTAKAKVAFLFNRVGLAGCDMGACAILPRIIGQGRASELLYTGRAMNGEEAERWGFFNRLAAPDTVLADASALARELADGPTFAHAMTKRMLEMEWAMSVEQAIEAEAVAQALCMETEDFARAYRAFAAKQKPVFEGN